MPDESAHGAAAVLVRPQRPVPALTIAVAGKLTLPAAARERLAAQLANVLGALAERLETLADGPGADDLARRFDLTVRPRLTLVTGLADGADRLAADVFLETHSIEAPCERLLGAVLPCASGVFAATSGVNDQAGFERQSALCDYIVELDGAMGEDALVNGRREAAFAAQSEMLLRHSDLLLAIDEAADVGRVGGTRETIRAALQLGLPVLLMRTDEAGVAVLRAAADFEEPVMLPGTAAGATAWRLAGELLGVGARHSDSHYARALVEEFFAPTTPKPTWRNRMWKAFEGIFATASAATAEDMEDSSPFHGFRERASQLASYYAGQYRGAFLMGYLLALLAVVVASLSLAVFIYGLRMGLGERELRAALGVLGFAKLSILIWLMALGRDANRRRLAHRAADWRYLTEQLRAMRYLPYGGALRAFARWSLPFTTRMSDQGIIDALFHSIVRQAKPLEVLEGPIEGRVLRQTPRSALHLIRRQWLEGQLAYHRRAARSLGRMARTLEGTSRTLNVAVVAVVAADLMIIVAGMLGFLQAAEALLAPALMLTTAVLPAAITSLSGVLFQSECSRLADRSEHMALQLALLLDRSALLDLRPIRALDALRLAEDVATLLIDEVVEWSAIYGKEFMEI